MPLARASYCSPHWICLGMGHQSTWEWVACTRCSRLGGLALVLLPLGLASRSSWNGCRELGNDQWLGLWPVEGPELSGAAVVFGAEVQWLGHRAFWRVGSLHAECGAYRDRVNNINLRKNEKNGDAVI